MDMAQYMIRALRDEQERRKPASEALWNMSPRERVAAMRRGELTWWQLCEWANRARHEVPLINDEYEFIAAFTPEVAEADD
jgi:hypothetical protein